jgi:hypothetical protein
MEHGIPALPTVPDSKRALASPSKSENARFHMEGRKAITCYSAGSSRSPVPQGTQKTSTSWHTSSQESQISPVQDLESQLFHLVAIHYSAGIRRPAPSPTVHRDPVLPAATAREPLHPIKVWEFQPPSLRGEKR